VLFVGAGKGGFFFFWRTRHQSFILADPSSDIIASTHSARQPAVRVLGVGRGHQGALTAAGRKIACMWTIFGANQRASNLSRSHISRPGDPPAIKVFDPARELGIRAIPISSQPDPELLPPCPWDFDFLPFLPQSHSSGRPIFPVFPVHSQFFYCIPIPSRPSYIVALFYTLRFPCYPLL